MEIMEGKNKVATMKMERVEGPAGGRQADAAQRSRQQRAQGREHVGAAARRPGAEHGADGGQRARGVRDKQQRKVGG